MWNLSCSVGRKGSLTWKKLLSWWHCGGSPSPSEQKVTITRLCVLAGYLRDPCVAWIRNETHPLTMAVLETDLCPYNNNNAQRSNLRAKIQNHLFVRHLFVVPGRWPRLLLFQLRPKLPHLAGKEKSSPEEEGVQGESHDISSRTICMSAKSLKCNNGIAGLRHLSNSAGLTNYFNDVWSFSIQPIRFSLLTMV